MDSSSTRNALVWIRRLLVVAFILSYLAAGVFFLYCHLLGQTRGLPWGYFWTWDMFPNYPSFSARRLALGETEGGHFVRVFPTNKMHYRRGGSGDYTRFDLPRNDAALRKAVEETLEAAHASAADDPVTYVFLVEEYWPVRFNLPDDLYRKAFGEENPQRHSFRILDEGPVEKTGEVHWTSAP